MRPSVWISVTFFPESVSTLTRSLRVNTHPAVPPEYQCYRCSDPMDKYSFWYLVGIFSFSLRFGSQRRPVAQRSLPGSGDLCDAHHQRWRDVVCQNHSPHPDTSCWRILLWRSLYFTWPSAHKAVKISRLSCCAFLKTSELNDSQLNQVK